MTMHKPCTRVVSRECNNNPTVRRQGDSVTTGRVGVLQILRVCRDVKGNVGARRASSRSQNVEVVTVKMNGVRNRCRNTLVSNLLDDPVHPLSLSGKLDQILSRRERVVTLLHVAQDGVTPLNVNSRGVDTPDDNVLVVCADVGEDETDVEGVCLRDELRRGADDVTDPGGEWAGLDALAEARCTVGVGLLGGGCGFLDAAVGDDSEAGAIVGGVAAEGFGLDAEPVVACSCQSGQSDRTEELKHTRCLISINDDFIALANVDHDTLNNDRLNRDKVGSDDSKVMTVHGHTEGVVNTGVDEAEEMTLASCDLDLEV